LLIKRLCARGPGRDWPIISPQSFRCNIRGSGPSHVTASHVWGVTTCNAEHDAKPRRITQEVCSWYVFVANRHQGRVAWFVRAAYSRGENDAEIPSGRDQRLVLAGVVVLESGRELGW